MARIAKKKTVDNNAGLLKVVVGINRKDVESVTDFGHFFIVILKDCAIFHTHIGFEARFKRWGGVDMEGHALTTTTFAWLENLVAMKNEVKGKENNIFPVPGILVSEDTEYYKNILNVNGRLIVMLDVDKLLKEEEMKALQKTVESL